MRGLLRLIFISIGILFIIHSSNAQVEQGAVGIFNEALLFSRTQIGGSARIQGLGGAQIALGGDPSSAFSNPAGLGLFNRSQVTFGPAIDFYNNDANYFNTLTNRKGAKFNLNNFGIVFNSSKNGASGPWRGGSFAISLTKLNNFNNKFSYEGRNTENSIIDNLIESANGISVNNIGSAGLAGLAYDVFLINPFRDNQGDIVDGEYDSFVLGLPRQSEEVVTEGSQYQWSFAYGGNFADKLYIGVGLGIATINYSQEKIFRESQFDETDPALDNLRVNENLEIEGTGINGTLGFIFRPNNIVRVGASVTTPTFYRLDEVSDVSIEANYNNFFYAPEDTVLNSLVAESDIILSKYELTTPLRLNGGIALFFEKYGFLSADIEFIDYASNSFSSSDFSTNADNRTIKDLYTSTINFRLGGEYRYNILRFRAGVAYYGDPYALEGFDGQRTDLSFGLGLKLANFSADLGIINSSSSSNYSPYTFVNGSGPVAQIDNGRTSAVFTLGFNF
ncbi:long-chain fatty acid transporter [Fulvivirgaceae bacterium BMA10]|uniref:Long-chain fatty acid transporter n=1 Tax=Splendidivirga corallicola TaxID=3051826 RepID=A0ABT8KXZ9_9BACT|nr:long-chain fatty acid transporter [Fulvivirgaceae bacterium BMA10]